MTTNQQRTVYSDNAFAELQHLRRVAEEAQAQLDAIQAERAKRAKGLEMLRRLTAASIQATLAVTSLGFSAAYAAQLGGGWGWGVAWLIGTPVVATALRLLALPNSELADKFGKK